MAEIKSVENGFILRIHEPGQDCERDPWGCKEYVFQEYSEMLLKLHEEFEEEVSPEVER